MIGVKKKLRRNNLSGVIEARITHGMLASRQVEQFLERMGEAIPRYPERLRRGFVEKYDEFRREGLEGDALFLQVQAFASQGRTEWSRQAASLAVVTHLFVVCDLFER